MVIWFQKQCGRIQKKPSVRVYISQFYIHFPFKVFRMYDLIEFVLIKFELFSLVLSEGHPLTNKIFNWLSTAQSKTRNLFLKISIISLWCSMVYISQHFYSLQIVKCKMFKIKKMFNFTKYETFGVDFNLNMNNFDWSLRGK